MLCLKCKASELQLHAAGLAILKICRNIYKFSLNIKSKNYRLYFLFLNLLVSSLAHGTKCAQANHKMTQPKCSVFVGILKELGTVNVFIT